MTDTATTTRTLVKGYREGTDLIPQLFGIRDMSATRGPDVAVFDTEAARDTALASPDSLYLSLTSDENGGHWRAPLTWESPDVDWATAEEAPDTSREAQAQALAAMRQREASALAELERYKGYYHGALAQAEAHEQELRALWNALKEQAVERDWCSEFEEFVNDNGGENYVELTRDVTVTLDITVSWRDSDDEDAIADKLYDMAKWDLKGSITSYADTE